MHCVTWKEGSLLWASYRIRKIAGCACAGNTGKCFPRQRSQRKLLVSDPGMHHGTCVTHVPWCMPGSLTRGGEENVPGIPGAYATLVFTYLVRGPLRDSIIIATSLQAHLYGNVCVSFIYMYKPSDVYRLQPITSSDCGLSPADLQIITCICTNADLFSLWQSSA